MDRFISDEQWRQLTQWITAQMGFHLPQERLPDLKRRLVSAAKEFSFDAVEPFVSWLLSTKLTQRQIEMLASHLTVGETYFYREICSLEALERYILPELIASRRSMKYLRIWSAGCATGEEPYTIAILLHRMIPDIEKWRITLLATDINARFLERAAQGIYREWSFRGDFQWLKDQYFTRTLDGRYRIAEKIREMVTFNYLNLATDPYPSLFNNTNAMDIIFCRNVLMYMEPLLAKRIIRRFYRALVDGGWAIPSVTEGFHLLSTQFVTVTFPRVLLYQKRENQGGELTVYSPWSPLEEEIMAGNPAEGLENPFVSPSDASFPDELPDSGLVTEGSPPFPQESLPLERVEKKTEESLYENALRLFRQGSYREGEKILKSFLEQNPENFQGYALMARLYADSGNLSAARTACEKALSLHKLDAGCHYLRAVILIEQQDFDEAEKALRCALYLEPDFVLAHFTLGNLARQRGQIPLSSKHFEHALLLLQNYQPDDILPESDGVTAGRLRDIIVTADLQRSFRTGS
ncbi:MCP methyltransferase, CheR-type [Syntrophus gentianae]|uniref:MCP methyltransferase, CheR-type n=1 Tax=Syntrophus gentianae TaxID=43775 RepID=A0A1H7X5Y6_9BACT|nr:CheR family methyltransferase [Syntrophus gentianae]SEM29123.1 MCP methyltransferase, CheR-type [Syntrophus gentianae]